LCVTPEHFAEHLQVLQKYRQVRLDQIEPRSTLFGGLSVAITFDDGYADNLDAAAPLLERFEVPCTFFITSGYIGADREFWWDELERMVWRSDLSPEMRDQLYRDLYEDLRPLPQVARCEQLQSLSERLGAPGPVRPSHKALTGEELRRLAEHPLFDIGAHTVTHPLLAAHPLETQRAEVYESKQRLEELLDRPIESFSYPYGGRGHYSDATVRVVSEAGFLRACTTEPERVRRRDSPFEWGRFVVSDSDGDQFEKFLLA
jgi:peptidoglycan/xylan/chitin deacetylase (PgdA/CDA1 family)